MKDEHDDYYDGLMVLLTPIFWVIDGIYWVISSIGKISKK